MFRVPEIIYVGSLKIQIGHLEFSVKKTLINFRVKFILLNKIGKNSLTTIFLKCAKLLLLLLLLSCVCVQLNVKLFLLLSGISRLVSGNLPPWRRNIRTLHVWQEAMSSHCKKQVINLSIKTRFFPPNFADIGKFQLEMHLWLLQLLLRAKPKQADLTKHVAWLIISCHTIVFFSRLNWQVILAQEWCNGFSCARTKCVIWAKTEVSSLSHTDDIHINFNCVLLLNLLYYYTVWWSWLY